MPENYYLSDLQPFLPFTPTDDDAPFPWRFEAASGHVLYLADDKGLWMRVLGEPEEPMNFEVITGFRPDELVRKKAGAIYIYTLKDGGAILPFPFTATQLLELDERAGRVFSERICCDGEGENGANETDELIAEIAQRSPRAAELARAVVYGEIPPEHGATSAPVADIASKAPGTQSLPMKKDALIAAFQHGWPSIAADINEASRNGLKAAAHAGKHGYWHAPKASEWAVSKGKIRQAAPTLPMALGWGAVTRNRS